MANIIKKYDEFVNEEIITWAMGIGAGALLGVLCYGIQEFIKLFGYESVKKEVNLIKSAIKKYEDDPEIKKISIEGEKIVDYPKGHKNAELSRRLKSRFKELMSKEEYDAFLENLEQLITKIVYNMNHRNSGIIG